MKNQTSPRLMARVVIGAAWLCSLYYLHTIEDSWALALPGTIVSWAIISTAVALLLIIFLLSLDKVDKANRVAVFEAYDRIKAVLDESHAWQVAPKDLLLRIVNCEHSRWELNPPGTMAFSSIWKGYYFQIHIGSRSVPSDTVLERDGNMIAFAQRTCTFVHRFSLFKNGKLLRTESP